MSSPAARRAAAFETEIRAELRALSARVSRHEARPRRPAPEDDGALMAAIALSVGACVFSAVDLLAVRDGELPALLDSMDARRLGSWLRRIYRQHGGTRYRLEKIGRDGRGILWAVDVGHHIHGDIHARLHRRG